MVVSRGVLMSTAVGAGRAPGTNTLHQSGVVLGIVVDGGPGSEMGKSMAEVGGAAMPSSPEGQPFPSGRKLALTAIGYWAGRSWTNEAFGGTSVMEGG